MSGLFRVFNPVTQGREHDPDGDVRRWVPVPGGVPAGYPSRIVDHAAERAEAISRYESLKSQA